MLYGNAKNIESNFLCQTAEETTPLDIGVYLEPHSNPGFA